MALKNLEILQWIREGRDNEALAAIYKNSLPKIRKYITSNKGNEEEVKDIFQDTIVIFYRKVKTGAFDENNPIDAFLYTVARNLYINYVNRHLKRNLKGFNIEETDESENVLQQLIGREKEEHIEKLFNDLGQKCAELLKLSIFHNFSMKEIAVKMGFANENVAKTKSYKCRIRLAALVKDKTEFAKLFQQ